MPTTNIAGKLRVGALESVEPLTVRGETVFDEVNVVEFTPVFEIDSSNGLSFVRRDTDNSTGSGTISNVNGEHVISTGTTSGSVASLRSKERGHYQSGIEGVYGLSVRSDHTFIEDQELRWGFFDDTDGAWFGYDSNGFFIRYRHNGTTEDKVYQEDWNGEDKLDGKGDSKITLSLNRHVDYRISLVWCGGGPIRFFIQTSDEEGESVNVNVHNVQGASGELILTMPGLPITVESDNGSTTEDVEVDLGGRYFAVRGRLAINQRTTPEERDGVSVAASATEPLISFRKKSDRTSSSKAVQVFDGSIIANQKGRVKIYIDPTLTDADFKAPSEVPASETALEADVSATGISGGTLLTAQMEGSGVGESTELAAVKTLRQYLPDDTIVTLAFQNLSGSAATVDAAFSCVEEW